MLGLFSGGSTAAELVDVKQSPVVAVEIEYGGEPYVVIFPADSVPKGARVITRGPIDVRTTKSVDDLPAAARPDGSIDVGDLLGAETSGVIYVGADGRVLPAAGAELGTAECARLVVVGPSSADWDALARAGLRVPASSLGEAFVEPALLGVLAFGELAAAIPSNLLPNDLQLPLDWVVGAIPAEARAGAKSTAVDGYVRVGALPAEVRSGLMVPQEVLRVSAIPSNAIPSNLRAVALPASALPASALPASLLPRSALPASAIPSNQLPKDLALPASALPASALPASARSAWVLAGDLRVGAKVPTSVIPISALPASAAPAAIPSNLLRSWALPASALPTSALPASARAGDYVLLDTLTKPVMIGPENLKKLALPASTLPPRQRLLGGGVPIALVGSHAIPSNLLPGRLELPASGLELSPSQLLDVRLPADVLADLEIDPVLLKRLIDDSSRFDVLGSNAIPSNAIPSNEVGGKLLKTLVEAEAAAHNGCFMKGMFAPDGIPALAVEESPDNAGEELPGPVVSESTTTSSALIIDPTPTTPPVDDPDPGPGPVAPTTPITVTPADVDGPDISLQGTSTTFTECPGSLSLKATTTDATGVVSVTLSWSVAGTSGSQVFAGGPSVWTTTLSIGDVVGPGGAPIHMQVKAIDPRGYYTTLSFDGYLNDSSSGCESAGP